ncbi:ExeM/NucH family extracellular endonuclease [Marinobacter sp. chi1]|uniref:ExeM/NucH family extracellular endonuclease n=1 Tax=Marinobacter suaedae TaxID=3057675 RepID=A0ABT8VZW0_9GAMM|nr:ExeM/NucH family extracellular endonuclease [Marinobacter sp. chi1]MDO3721466.1 ExeM/NucH family extracellular endonuclease [Marinobacter sp. chi1]
MSLPPVFRRTLSAALLLLIPIGSVASECGAPATPISEIQGSGPSSPLAGQTVTVEGILTLDSRMTGGWRGFYLQQADHQTDGDPGTSEAIFVYTRRKGGRAGDRLRITASVKEYHGLTELVGVKQLSNCGKEYLPEAITVTHPWSTPPEALENMHIRFDTPLVVVDNYQLARYGTLALAAADGIISTEVSTPDAATKGNAQRLVLDDGRATEHPRPIPWPPGGLSTTQTIRAGDQVAGLSGVLDFRFGEWRLQPDSAPDFQKTNPRTPAPERLRSPHIRVMTMNLGNLFNGNGKGDGFPASRGARSNKDFEEQQRRLVNALTQPDPDILSLAELENDGYGANSSARELASALGPAWRVVETPGADGSDAIRTALLYRADRVQPAGNPRRLTTGPFHNQGRPPIAQVFRPLSGGAGVRVVSVHFKSKGCGGARGADQDQKDGQGCFASRRTREAEAVLDWLATQRDDDTVGSLVTGDLNAYARETPLQRFYALGYTSTVHDRHPCSAQHCPYYTFRFKGARGTLDYALASPGLQARILDARVWMINADEPPVIGYQSDLDPKTAIPWRTSDHNPVITDIGLH